MHDSGILCSLLPAARSANLCPARRFLAPLLADVVKTTMQVRLTARSATLLLFCLYQTRLLSLPTHNFFRVRLLPADEAWHVQVGHGWARKPVQGGRNQVDVPGLVRVHAAGSFFCLGAGCGVLRLCSPRVKLFNV